MHIWIISQLFEIVVHVRIRQKCYNGERMLDQTVHRLFDVVRSQSEPRWSNRGLNGA